MSEIYIRDAVAADVPTITQFIHALAAFEKLSHACVAREEDVAKALFGTPARAHVVMAEMGDAPVGFALYFYNFSTFLATPGIYIEDVFVRETHRGHGVGRALFQHLAVKALAEGCGRLEWWVLDWNEKAIQFYQSIGAVAMDEWTVQRVEGDALKVLACHTP